MDEEDPTSLDLRIAGGYLIRISGRLKIFVYYEGMGRGSRRGRWQ